MTSNIKLGAVLASALILGGLTACSSSPTRLPVEGANGADKAHSMQQEIADGFTNHYDILDKSDFDKAQSSLKDAEDAMHNGDKQAKIDDRLQLSQAYLAKAKSEAQVLKPATQGILDSRTAALNAGARRFPGPTADLSKADDQFRDNLSDLRNSKLSTAGWSTLQNNYLNVELKSIEDTQLAETRAKLDSDAANGAEKNTPRTLKQARLDVTAATNAIAADRHNEAAFAPAVKKAKESVQLLSETLTQTKQPGSVIPEPVALSMVMKNRKINALNTEASSAKNQLGQTQEELNKKTELLSLTDALNAARKEFNSQEADVYTQGDKLLIRLKDMKFAVGKAELPQESMDTLNKVKDIAQKLGPQQVVIEGHTDSTGGAAKNLELSQTRAQTVAAYFEKNGIDSDKVEAVGYGFKKPLASNKTKVGRATNRRVDIIITPSAAPKADGTSAAM